MTCWKLQTDGDSPIQNIVTGLREKSRERVTNGLRSFVALDTRCAVEMGHLRRGLRPFQGQETGNRCISEVLREGADDLTSRAKEVDTLEACINVYHVGENCGDRHWWSQSGTLLAKQFKKELKEVSGTSCTIITEI